MSIAQGSATINTGSADAAEYQRQRLADGAACLAAALDYQRLGWSVLALCPPDHAGVGRKHGDECKTPGKRPWHFWGDFQTRQATDDEIKDWWRQKPTSNVGSALGPLSGLVRIDADGPGVERLLAEWSGGDLPPTLEFTSGRENVGRGLLYAIPPAVIFATTAEAPRPNEELRFQALGALTVLPPSRHHTGTLYQWKPGHGPHDIEAATAPLWMVKRWGVSNGHAKERKRAEPLTDGQPIDDGNRDTLLTSLAGTMRRRGLSFEAIQAALLVTNERQCRPPLEDHLVIKVARSVAGYEAADPALAAIEKTGQFTPPEPWAPPVPFNRLAEAPPFPTHLLPQWLSEWVAAEAEATQTPPDLAGSLALACAGAAIAGAVRVRIRDDWMEPANIFTVVALPPGDRKSAVFADATAPLREHERQERERMAPVFAEKASEHRVMEHQLKALELKAAKEEDDQKASQSRKDAKDLAKKLASHVVPDEPQLFCDDVTPEKLVQLLVRQGGRMLMAGAEGTAFEIAKGRYSEKANFDVYLKGHAGEPLRTGRVGRVSESVDMAALSCALAVQPDVIRGLAEQAIMKGRGFLARWLYSIPVSKVGSRTTAPAGMPAEVAARYMQGMLRLWQLPKSRNFGLEAAWELEFSHEADDVMRDFERWLEPQLREGEPLACLAGWASKLAGAIARLSLITHMAGTLGAGSSWNDPVSADTVQAAVALGRDYYMPHALAAFGMMGANEKAKDAARVVGWLVNRWNSESLKVCKGGGRTVSRSVIHTNVFGGSRAVDDVIAICRLLCEHGYLRNAGPAWRRDIQMFEVNPGCGEP